MMRSDVWLQVGAIERRERQRLELHELGERADALRVVGDIDADPVPAASGYRWRVTHGATCVVFAGATLLDGLRDAVAYLEALVDPSSRPGLVIHAAALETATRLS